MIQNLSSDVPQLCMEVCTAFVSVMKLIGPTDLSANEDRWWKTVLTECQACLKKNEGSFQPTFLTNGLHSKKKNEDVFGKMAAAVKKMPGKLRVRSHMFTLWCICLWLLAEAPCSKGMHSLSHCIHSSFCMDSHILNRFSLASQSLQYLCLRRFQQCWYPWSWHE